MDSSKEKLRDWKDYTGTDILVFKELDSTNIQAKKYIHELIEDGGTEDIRTVIIADHQTSGRGRMGRHWESPAGTGIWMSLIVSTDMEGDRIPGVTLLAALSVVRAVNNIARDNSIYNIEAGIKWPNDVIINEKKLSGILTELVVDPADKRKYIICGIGINVNDHRMDGEIYKYATSLRYESGVEWNRDILAAEVIRTLVEYISAYEVADSLEFIQRDYNSRLLNMNRRVRLISESRDNNEDEYISRGIDESGALIVESGDGTIEHIVSGEVSVRGLYGYV